jgi:uncharacterized protein
MSLPEFEWDPDKNTRNIEQHGIDFEDAKLIFASLVLTSYSPRNGEDRYVALGQLHGVTIAVVYCDRDGKRRLISARPAHSKERKRYGEIAHRLGAAEDEDTS